jgi:hypothetical protein
VAQTPKDTLTKVKTDTVKVDPEKEAFENRRMESLKAHHEQAGVLAKEGIPFSFGTMSGKPGDFSKHIRTMMKNGLSFDKALSALTTHPAKLLGVDKYCGTVEVGKMANVIVSTKPLFEEDAAIRFMVVEGNLYEYDLKEKKKSSGKESKEAITMLEGTWTYTIETPDQQREGKFEFSDKEGKLTGTISSSDVSSGNDQLNDIVIDGKTVSFTFDWEINGQPVELEFDLKLKEETFDGSVTVGDIGTFPISGQRISKPD